MDDTIVAISTPIGEGGIGIVRLSGARALAIADKIFVSKDGKKPSEIESHTVHYGWIINLLFERGRNYASRLRSKNNFARVENPLTRSPAYPHTNIIDEVLLTVMKAPKSYTKEDIVEINCHGGIQAVKHVMELTLKYGARVAEPGEFTKRAFLNGRIDLAQAEAVLDVIRAKTEGSLKIAVGQLEGELSKSVNEIREEIINITAEIEASIDFPEEDLELSKKDGLKNRVSGILNKLGALVKSYDNGIVFREGVLAIICGKPNVGKSSLMNLLLKRDRVIVSSVPGTTRDAVEEVINLNGIPIRLVDTAGIFDTKDMLEKEGVKKSKKYLALSDIVILMLDASTKIEKKDKSIINLIGAKKKIVVVNKIDIAGKPRRLEIKKLFKSGTVIEISVKNKDNIARLENAIQKTVLGGGFNQGEGSVVTSARQKEALDRAYKSMLSVKRAVEKGEAFEITAIDLKEAIFNTGLVAGKSVSDDILDRIFSRFCVGK